MSTLPQAVQENLGMMVAKGVSDRTFNVSALRDAHTGTAILCKASGFLPGLNQQEFMTPGVDIGGDATTDGYVDFNFGIASTEGWDERNATVEDMQNLVWTDPSNYARCTFIASSYHAKNPVILKEDKLDRYKNSLSGITTLVEDSINGIVGSKWLALDAHLFPAGVDINTPDWTNYGAQSNRVMAFREALLTGYANNSATADATNYQYGTVNLNQTGLIDYSRLKAISVGSTTTAFGYPTPTNLNTKIKFPMADRCSKQVALGGLNLALTGDSVYQWILDYWQNYTVLMKIEGALEAGFDELRSFMGIPFFRSSSHNGLARSVIDFVNLKSWKFQHHNWDRTISLNGQELETMEGVAMAWRWNHKARIMCMNPWLNALAYNVTTS